MPRRQGSVGVAEWRKGMARKAIWGFLVVLLAGSWAGADWLVLKDGSRIQTRGQAVVVDGEVGYFDLTGQIRRFRDADLDINATKLMNIAARRKRVPGEEHFVIDDDQVGHVDPEMAEAIREYRDAKDDNARQRAFNRFIHAAENVGTGIGKDLRCQDKYPDDWGAQALCKAGKTPPPGVVARPGKGKGVEQLEEASRAFRCRQLYPNNEFNYQVCLEARK
jgi:hypothetical protein